MKISRSHLKQLVHESIHEAQSVLLEMPSPNLGAYDQNNDEKKISLCGQQLFHMGQQSNQLHDMLKDDAELSPEIEEKIKNISNALEDLFKAVIYDKQNPEGR